MKVYAVMLNEKPVILQNGSQFEDEVLVTTDPMVLPIFKKYIAEMNAMDIPTTLLEIEVEAPYRVCRGLANQVPDNEPQGEPLKGHPLCLCHSHQAMFCQFGHILECHFPFTCEVAKCSHLSRSK